MLLHKGILRQASLNLNHGWIRNNRLRATLWVVIIFKRNQTLLYLLTFSFNHACSVSFTTTFSLSSKWKVQLHVKRQLNQQAPCRGLGLPSLLQSQVCSIHYCSWGCTSIRRSLPARVHPIAFTAYETVQACSQELPGRLGITVTVNSSELPVLDGWVVTPFSGCPLGEKVEKQREGIRVTLHSWAGSCRWIGGKHWQGSTLGRLKTTSQSHFYQSVLLGRPWCPGMGW